MHLFGYPHVERWSTGVHDRLFASALYLSGGKGRTLFIANDVIFIPKDLAARARHRIAEATGVPANSIMISATHTHSGPGTVAYASNVDDPTVPPPDPAFLQQLEDGIVEAAKQAVTKHEPAEVALVIADGACVGANRRDPKGPANPRVPVLLVRGTEHSNYIAAMMVCSMHPTVLHEDSTVISGDFPAFAKQRLQDATLGKDCVVLFHSGASGNQSPRHVIKETTMAEARRLGEALADSVAQAMADAQFIDRAEVVCDSTSAMLERRAYPTEAEAQAALAAAQQRYDALRQSKGASPETRTAECDVFGAEETVTLSRLAAEGRLDEYASSCMPAEVQAIRIGPWIFLGLPGEWFVEFALEIEEQFPDTFVITMATGELQGYVVTEKAVREGGYEASNALFKSPESGRLLIELASNLLNQLNAPARASD